MGTTPTTQVEKLSDEIIGVDLLIQDLNNSERNDGNDIVRIDWAESLIKNLERQVILIVGDNLPKNQVKSLSDNITDLKNDLMQAKERISLSMKQDMDPKISPKKTSITDRTVETVDAV